VELLPGEISVDKANPVLVNTVILSPERQRFFSRTDASIKQ